MFEDVALEFTAGWAGGAAGLVVGHPLDTIKVRVQSLPYASVLQCLKQTFRDESAHGFYKGMLFPFLSAGLLHSLYFGGYGLVLKVLDDGENCAKSKQQRPIYSHVFLGSVFGAVLQFVPSCPIEVVKVKLQVQTSKRGNPVQSPAGQRFLGPLNCLKEIRKQRGIRGLYRGGTILLYRDVISLASYLPCYEFVSRGTISKFPEKLAYLPVILAGGVAGLVSWLLILPLDLIKSRLQADDMHKPNYAGILDCAQKSYKKEGFPVFFRGWFMVAARAFPVNAIIFLAYEKFKAHFCYEFI